MKSKVISRTTAVFAAVLSVVIASLLVVPVFASAQARHVSGERGDGSKPTIVLVHGGWADGSSWDHVISILQWEGYTVDSPPNPLRGLASDSAYLASYLKTISGPVILVGHSVGGMVISNAATGNPNVKGLVYVDAFEPAAGESVEQLTFAQPGSCLAGDGNLNNVFNFARGPVTTVGRLRRLFEDPRRNGLPRVRRVLRDRRSDERGERARSDAAANCPRLHHG